MEEKDRLAVDVAVQAWGAWVLGQSSVGWEVHALPETNSSPLKIGRAQKERIVFQPSIFRCKLFASGRGRWKEN